MTEIILAHRVTTAKAGVQAEGAEKSMDSGFRRNNVAPIIAQLFMSLCIKRNFSKRLDAGFSQVPLRTITGGAFVYSCPCT